MTYKPTVEAALEVLKLCPSSLLEILDMQEAYSDPARTPEQLFAFYHHVATSTGGLLDATEMLQAQGEDVGPTFGAAIGPAIPALKHLLTVTIQALEIIEAKLERNKQ